MKYEPHDIIAMTIAFGLLVFLVSLSIESAFYEIELTDEKVNILNTLLLAMISIISMYIGSKLKNNK